MPVDVGRTLRQALSKLTAERLQLDRQINAIETAFQATGGPVRGRSRGRGRRGRRVAARRTKRRRMSAAARKAVSARMKAYWAKRRSGGGKKATPRKKKAATGGKEQA